MLEIKVMLITILEECHSTMSRGGRNHSKREAAHILILSCLPSSLVYMPAIYTSVSALTQWLNFYDHSVAAIIALFSRCDKESSVG